MSQQPPLPPQPAPDTAVLFQLLRSWEKAYGPLYTIPKEHLETLRELFRSLDIAPAEKEGPEPFNHRIAFLGGNPLLQKVQVPVPGGIHLVEVNEILYIKSKNYDGHRGTQVYLTRGRRIQSTTTLKKIETNIFSALPFLQVHRSYIINVQRVRIYLPNAEFVYLDIADLIAKFSNNAKLTDPLAETDSLKKIPVGKTYRPALEQFLHSFASL